MTVLLTSMALLFLGTVQAAPVERIFLTRRETAEVTSLSERYIAELEKQGVLPATRFGRAVRYAVEDVRALKEKLAGDAS